MPSKFKTTPLAILNGWHGMRHAPEAQRLAVYYRIVDLTRQAGLPLGELNGPRLNGDYQRELQPFDLLVPFDRQLSARLGYLTAGFGELLPELREVLSSVGLTSTACTTPRWYYLAWSDRMGLENACVGFGKYHLARLRRSPNPHWPDALQVTGIQLWYGVQERVLSLQMLYSPPWQDATWRHEIATGPVGQVDEVLDAGLAYLAAHAVPLTGPEYSVAVRFSQLREEASIGGRLFHFRHRLQVCSDTLRGLPMMVDEVLFFLHQGADFDDRLRYRLARVYEAGAKLTPDEWGRLYNCLGKMVADMGTRNGGEVGP